MLQKMTIVSALLILILVDQLKAQGTPVTPVLEVTSVEQSSDPSTQPGTELPPDYSGDSHTGQPGNNGVQEGEQTFWDLSGESSAESTPKPSVEPSQESTQKSSTEISDQANGGPFQKEKGDLTTLDKEDAGVLNFCASVFNGMCSSHTTQVKKGRCRDWEDEDPQPTAGEDQACYHVRFENVHKSVGPSEAYPWVLWELADKVAEPLPIISEKSWQSGELPDDGKKGNVTHIFKKGKAKHLGNQSVFTSVPGKVTEQILLETMLMYLANKEVTGNSQNGFTRGKSCLTNLLTFHDRATALVDR
ncbi:hypothetical protein DUI87_18647 [Hirundo rustica rustica]|uniref:Reverse transcriptase domain-containing protein n=1 Tax=Hirundo rustica rustica TaxID=333673 RepID=A0A3M0K2K3_HIRRU|nr:hypothetical protein DUI87_18647 [Hirundo rustica rustica]